MRAVLAMAGLLALGCGAPSAVKLAPRLAPPDALDQRAPGAAYLATVANRLEPGWSQFLADCRARLPASHPLNAMALAATAELAIDAAGQVTSARIAASSGNADFDRAVREVIADAHELGVPPSELLADDDRVHVRWLFARDHRQAGPATAALVTLQLPLADVVPRLVAHGELPRAARRIWVARAGDDRTAAIRRLMIAALAEALAGADDRVRRAAIDAIARVQATELAPNLRALLAETSGAELRAAAALAAAALGDGEVAPRLLADLPRDLAEQPAVALAETRALVLLGRDVDAARVVADTLERAPNSAAALAFVLAPQPDRVPALAARFAHGDAATRALLCGALAAAPAAGEASIAAGLHDADANVRASCAEAATGLGPAARRLVPRLVELVRDRDRSVRARAVAALAAIDPSKLPVIDDGAPLVRAAYASALAAVPGRVPALHALADDRDPDVRAAAWRVLAARSAGNVAAAAEAVQAAGDASPQVRLAVVPALVDEAALTRLASADEPELRAAALVRLVALRGRAASEPELLERLAASPKASAERVRIALAWLLAS